MPGTVTVGCRIPSGMTLRVYEMAEFDEPVFGGGVKIVKRARQVGAEAKINGNAKRMGVEVPHDIRGGVALTYGVDADLWSRWLEANKDEPYVKNGSIFAQPSEKARVEIPAQSRDVRQQKTGMEPLDMNDLPPEFRGKIERTVAA